MSTSTSTFTNVWIDSGTTVTYTYRYNVYEKWIPFIEITPINIDTFVCDICGRKERNSFLELTRSFETYGIKICESCYNGRKKWILKDGKCIGLLVGTKIIKTPEVIAKFSGIQVIVKARIPLIEYEHDDEGIKVWQNFQELLSLV